MHHHPDNKGAAPKLLSSYQSIYPRTKVDLNSRWLLEWENVGQAALMSDMGTKCMANMCCAIQCEEGDLIIHCEYQLHLIISDHRRRRL